MSALPQKADIDLHRAHLKRGLARRWREETGGPALAPEAPGKGIPTQQRTRLLVFARAGSDAVVRGLRVHDRIGVILHCARDLLGIDAVAPCCKLGDRVLAASTGQIARARNTVYNIVVLTFWMVD